MFKKIYYNGLFYSNLANNIFVSTKWPIKDRSLRLFLIALAEKVISLSLSQSTIYAVNDVYSKLVEYEDSTCKLYIFMEISHK